MDAEPGGPQEKLAKIDQMRLRSGRRRESLGGRQAAAKGRRRSFGAFRSAVRSKYVNRLYMYIYITCACVHVLAWSLQVHIHVHTCMLVHVHVYCTSSCTLNCHVHVYTCIYM